MSRIHVGISGWTYGGWRGDFYPEGLAHRRELAYASRMVNTVEINGTFYSLQKPQYFESWREQTPRGFRFAVKGSRFITHMKHLRDIRTPLANFLASGVLRLEEKLGPILWQFSPRMRFDADRFRDFLDLLPTNTADAATLARSHDARLEGRASFHADVSRTLLHAFEVRHESFMVPAFIDMLREYGAALVFSDAADDWPYAEDVTSSFIYIRLHGADETYASGYGTRALNRWARRIECWSEGTEPNDAVRVAKPARKRAGRDVYVYFDNDRKVRAPFDALSLARRLGIDWKERHGWPD